MPIVIVPAGTAMITLLNVKDFLEDHGYKSVTELKAVGAKKDTTVFITRKSRGQLVKYMIIDNPQKLGDKDWKRVVSVFAAGPAWQFKGWPWPSPTEVFSAIQGFYLKYDDEQAPDTIKSWNVKLLNISKKARHADSTAVLDFWKTIDDFISTHTNFQNLNY